MGIAINERFTEQVGVVGVIKPQSITTAVLTAAIDMSKSRKVTGYLLGGALAGGESVTFLASGCSTSGGSYNTISGTSLTLTKASPDFSAGIQPLEITAEGLNALGLSYRYIKFSVACGTGSVLGLVAIAGGGPEEPQSNLNIAACNAATIL